MKLLLLPFMMCIELFLLFAVFIIGIIRPSLGLDLCDWFSAHLPSRDWYWGLKMDVSPRRLPNPADDRTPASGVPDHRLVGQLPEGK